MRWWTRAGIWSHGRTAQRVRVGLVVLVAEAFLVVLVVAGWQALQDQRIRHGENTVRVTATVTDTVRQCGKGGCTWLSLGRYELDGRVQEGVVLVDSSHEEQRQPQTMLVDPAHPRRAVNLHDHGTVWLVLAPIGVVALVVLDVVVVRWIRRVRRAAH